MKTAFRLCLTALAMAAMPSVYGVDLMNLYEQARAHDANYLAAQRAREAGLESRAQGRALLRPSVNFAGDLSYNAVDVDDGPRRQSARSSLTLQATQPIFNRDRWLAAEQGDLNAQIAEAQFELDNQDLMLRVAEAYFNVLAAQDAVELAKAQKAATTQQLAQAKKAFEVGTATITDTHEAQARQDLILAQEIAAENDLAVARNALRQITGGEPQDLVPLPAASNLGVTAPVDLPLWLDRAGQQNWRLQIQRLAESISAREYGRAQAARLPTLDAYASAGRNNDPENTQGLRGQNSASVGLQLRLPIYAGGGLTSRVRETLALREQARNETEAARREVEQSVRQAYLGATSGLARIRALEQALVSTQSTLDSTLLGRQVGVRTNLDVLNAQQQYYSARRDLSQAKYEYIVSRLQLEAAAGELTLDDLQRVNGLLAQ